jgi:uncharacterized membrane protein
MLKAMMNGNYSSGGGWALMIFGSLVLAVLIAGLFWCADRSSRRGSSDRASPASDTETARQRLDERLARGKIDTAQYQSRVVALHEDTPAT